MVGGEGAQRRVFAKRAKRLLGLLALAQRGPQPGFHQRPDERVQPSLVRLAELAPGAPVLARGRAVHGPDQPRQSIVGLDVGQLAGEPVGALDAPVGEGDVKVARSSSGFSGSPSSAASK